METHIIIEHGFAHVEAGDVKDYSQINNDSCATPLKKIEEEFGAEIYLQIDSLIFHMMQDGRTEMITDIDISEDFGIVGIYKGDQIGFTPIGKYNDSEKYTFGDANYFLLSELGQTQYNRFETHILKAVNNGKKSGQFEDLIKWEMTTESKYNKQQV